MKETVIGMRDGNAAVTIHPGCGGAVGEYGLLDRAGIAPLFQTRPDPTRQGAFALGCALLAPWSNRISGGGFSWEGHFHRLAPNVDGEPYPLHGTLFSAPFTLETERAECVVLSYASEGSGPFRYDARVTYRLEGGALSLTLALTNTGDQTLPFGGGFHPFFVRTPATRLMLHSAGAWTERADHLPDTHLAPDQWPDTDFRSGKTLPAGWTNAALTGWDGRADIVWPDRGLALEISASAPLTVAMLYAPDPEADFFCLEPVSHTVDAHNRSGAGVVPPQPLAPDARLDLCVRFTPRRTN